MAQAKAKRKSPLKPRSSPKARARAKPKAKPSIAGLRHPKAVDPWAAGRRRLIPHVGDNRTLVVRSEYAILRIRPGMTRKELSSMLSTGEATLHHDSHRPGGSFIAFDNDAEKGQQLLAELELAEELAE